jgi:hypothetical protein
MIGLPADYLTAEPREKEKYMHATGASVRVKYVTDIKMFSCAPRS